MEGVTVQSILNDASTIITTAVSTTGTLVNGLPWFLLPMAFVFGKKFVSFARSLTLQKSGKRR